MSEKLHILVVDDDDRLRGLMAQYLGEQGFYVTPVGDAKQARAMLSRFAVDAMVLDVMMPGENGLAFLASLPAVARPPTLFLSAQGEAEQRISGLEAGAEDYLAKPFEPKELVLRLRTILRRHSTSQRVRFGAYEFSLSSQQLQHAGVPVHLTGGEVQLLKILAAHVGRPVSREMLAKVLAGEISDRGIDVQVTRLRKKIEVNPAKPVYIQTVRGVGYLLAAIRKNMS